MNTNRYRISELAEKAGVTKRTIHYYIGRGLLPSPDGAGLGTTYTDEHLYRILLIKKLQDAFLPLDEIKRRVAGMSLLDVRQSLEDDGSHARVMEQVSEYVIPGISGTGGCVSKNSKEGTNEESDTDANRTADTDMAGNACLDRISGIVYEQLNIKFGLEIHFPAKNERARELAEILYKYADRIIKDS